MIYKVRRNQNLIDVALTCYGSEWVRGIQMIIQHNDVNLADELGPGMELDIRDVNTNDLSLQYLAQRDVHVVTGHYTVEVTDPTGLLAVALGEVEVYLSWNDNSDNEFGFEIWRATGSGAFELIQSLPPDSVNWSDTAVEAGITYSYKVRANVVFTEVATVTVPFYAPSELVAQAFLDDLIKLTWVDNSESETGYEIWRSETPEVGYNRLATVYGTLEYSDSDGLETEKTYYYKVRAVNASAVSDFSNEASATTLYAIVFNTTLNATESKPFNVSITYQGDNAPIWLFPDATLQAGDTLYIVSGKGFNGQPNVVKLFVEDRALLYKLSIINGELFGAVDLTGMTGLGHVNFFNNNIENLVFNSIGNQVTLFDFRNNNLRGSLNLDLIDCADTVQIRLSNNSISAINYTKNFRFIEIGNNQLTELDLSKCTVYGSNAIVSAGVNPMTKWFHPTMDENSTLRILQLNQTYIEQEINDTWVTRWATGDCFLNNGYFTKITIQAPGYISRFRAFNNAYLKELDLSEMNPDSNAQIQISISDCILLSNFKPMNTSGRSERVPIVILDLQRLPLVTDVMDLSGFDSMDSRSNTAIGTWSLAGNHFSSLTLPENVSHPIRLLRLRDSENYLTYDIQGLGNGAFDMDLSSLDVSSCFDKSSEVNRILSEMDSITNAGYNGRQFSISGNNPAPDSSSGGYDGTAALASLVQKGFVVFSN